MFHQNDGVALHMRGRYIPSTGTPRLFDEHRTSSKKEVSVSVSKWVGLYSVIASNRLRNQAGILKQLSLTVYWLILGLIFRWAYYRKDVFV